MCKQHTRLYRKLDKEAKQRKRAQRRAEGLCIWCPGDSPSRATPPSPTCLACRVKHRKVRISDGAVSLDVYLQQRESQIVAATSRDIAGHNGRVRYRGQQKRGQQPKTQLNVQDLVHVQKDYDGFVAGVMVLVGSEVDQLHQSDRVKVEKATARLGDRAARRMGDIVTRLGHRRDYPDGTPTGLPDPDDVDPDVDTLTYKRPSDAQRVAAAAQPGQLVYAPPLDVVSGRRETGKQSVAPDLAGLRAQLAGRGLRLVDEGAFYWRVIKNGE